MCGKILAIYICLIVHKLNLCCDYKGVLGNSFNLEGVPEYPQYKGGLKTPCIREDTNSLSILDTMECKLG